MTFNKTLFLAVSLIGTAAFADATYVTTTDNFNSMTATGDEYKCDSIDPVYLQEQLIFNKLSRQLQDLLHEPDPAAFSSEISSLKTELEVHTERLIELARPEWNTEDYRIALYWEIPAEHFFPDPKLIRGAFYKKNGEFLSFDIKQIYLMGERRPDLVGYGGFGIWIKATPPPNSMLQVSLFKPATLLEFCQFVHTIEINIDVNYVLKSFPNVPLTERLKLVFGGNS